MFGIIGIGILLGIGFMLAPIVLRLVLRLALGAIFLGMGILIVSYLAQTFGLFEVFLATCVLGSIAIVITNFATIGDGFPGLLAVACGLLVWFASKGTPLGVKCNVWSSLKSRGGKTVPGLEAPPPNRTSVLKRNGAKLSGMNSIALA
jgi:hypothetical protein